MTNRSGDRRDGDAMGAAGDSAAKTSAAVEPATTFPGDEAAVGADVTTDDRGAERTLAIETNGLVKHFGETKAVDGVDLAVPAGGVYGLLGPNGAGKTTIIRLLTTLLTPDSGTARILGHDVEAESGAVRRRISLTGQFASVDEDLTGRENLVFLARLEGYSRSAAKERASDLLDAFGLQDAANRQVKTYSGGMRRRLDIAASVVVTPDLLFLDEPTTGLDPRNRNQVWTIIRALVDDGTTVLLTTQYLEEADRLADRIAVIDDGTIIAEGTPGELKSSVGSGVLDIRVREPAQRAAAVAILADDLGVPVEPGSDPTAITATVAETETAVEAFDRLADAAIDLTDFALGQPSLDEVFLALTDHPATDARSGTADSNRRNDGRGHRGDGGRANNEHGYRGDDEDRYRGDDEDGSRDDNDGSGHRGDHEHDERDGGGGAYR